GAVARVVHAGILAGHAAAAVVQAVLELAEVVGHRFDVVTVVELVVGDAAGHDEDTHDGEEEQHRTSGGSAVVGHRVASGGSCEEFLALPETLNLARPSQAACWPGCGV